ncbi:MAG: dihydroorotase, partial [Firmicutes bacterium]|nr:dihydroorotase [Bacillota bacterium]
MFPGAWQKSRASTHSALCRSRQGVYLLGHKEKTMAADLSRFNIEKNGYLVFPGFCDVHVHFREPGFSYKATILTESRAAARGGYTDVCAMPNLRPVPDSLEHLAEEEALIERGACINVLPYGSITVGELGQELSDMEVLAPRVCAFSDDGKGVQSEELMRAAMLKAKSLGKLIVAHCELAPYPPEESEWREIERDVRLAKETGCAYHVCHVSQKKSVEIIRQAKAEGVDVTCETAPQYLILTKDDVRDDGRFRVNPPIAAEEDRLACIEGIKDGTIDMIITDHAPHSAEEKGRGFAKSSPGFVGLEICFPLLYTELVKTGVISLEKLVGLMTDAPRRRFGIPEGDSCTVWDLSAEYSIDPEDFVSMGRATPFAGRNIFGRCIATIN